MAHRLAADQGRALTCRCFVFPSEWTGYQTKVDHSDLHDGEDYVLNNLVPYGTKTIAIRRKGWGAQRPRVNCQIRIR